MDYGFIPMSAYIQEMKRDAVRQAKKAFKDGREQIYLAMTVIYDVMEYVKKEGFVALSDDDFFRDGKPYVLDLVEEKEHGDVPLRKYLAFGLELVSNGESSEVLEEFMVNRYYANSYVEKDAFIACIYCIGLAGLIYGYGAYYEQLMEYYASLIPDEEECAFREFANEKKKLCDAEKYQYMRRTLVRKFKVWDADRDSLELDRNSMQLIFNELLENMGDENMKKLLPNICNTDLCYCLLAVNDSVRKHMMELLSQKLRFILMEDLMRMAFDKEAGVECMESVGRIMKVWVMMQKDAVSEKS